jgi:hypothetical protein
MRTPPSGFRIQPGGLGVRFSSRLRFPNFSAGPYNQTPRGIAFGEMDTPSPEVILRASLTSHRFASFSNPTYEMENDRES